MYILYKNILTNNIYSGSDKLPPSNTSFQYLAGKTGAIKIILKSKTDKCSLAYTGTQSSFVLHES